ncbi:hypothetical protein MY3296_000574 [Beauveria thailandica]
MQFSVSILALFASVAMAGKICTPAGVKCPAALPCCPGLRCIGGVNKRVLMTTVVPVDVVSQLLGLN